MSAPLLPQNINEAIKAVLTARGWDGRWAGVFAEFDGGAALHGKDGAHIGLILAHVRVLPLIELL